MKYKNIILSEFNEAKKILNLFLQDEKNIIYIEKAAMLIANCFKSGGKVFSCGNGGSHCDAMHFSEELMGRYRENRIGYPAICISDSSYISCISNDYNYEVIFSRYIDTVGKKEDVLLGISTSGKSKNIIQAIKSSNKKKMKVILLTGKDGGKIAEMSSHIKIIVPHFGFSDRIQELHIKIIHILVLLIEKEMCRK